MVLGIKHVSLKCLVSDMLLYSMPWLWHTRLCIGCMICALVARGVHDSQWFGQIDKWMLLRGASAQSLCVQASEWGCAICDLMHCDEMSALEETIPCSAHRLLINTGTIHVTHARHVWFSSHRSLEMKHYELIRGYVTGSPIGILTQRH